MSRGRKPKGRPAHLNPGRVTRTASHALATQLPGAGVWRNQHDRKTLFPLFCEALKEERGNFRSILPGDLYRGRRRGVYSCTYGSHWLLTSARHWHIGRAPGPRE